MSIVSKQDDTFKIYGKKHPIKAVYRDMGEPYTPQYQFPPQTATFADSKRLSKPFGLASLTGKPAGVVPLKSLQEGTHAGSMLFNAPENLDVVPLKVPIYEPTKFKNYEGRETYNPHFPQYSYYDGARPSVRPLSEYPVSEPTDPYPSRPEKVAYHQYKVTPYPVHYQLEDEIMAQVRGL